MNLARSGRFLEEDFWPASRESYPGAVDLPPNELLSSAIFKHPYTPQRQNEIDVLRREDT